MKFWPETGNRFQKAYHICRYVAAVAAVLYCLLIYSAAQASSGSCEWTPPTNLSVTPESHSGRPAAIGDLSGRVHVFWIEQTGAQTQQSNFDSIIYRYWEDDSWSQQFDVLVGPEGGWADLADVAVSTDNAILYLLWYDSLGVNFSSAPIQNAANAHSWQTKRIYAGAGTGYPALTVDQDGTLHALYTEDWRSLVYVKSSNRGQSWSEPSTVASVPTSASAIDFPTIAIDREGTIHAAWQVNFKEADWLPTRIAYSKSTDGGQSWFEQWQFDRDQGGQPTLIVDKSDALQLLWNGRAGSHNQFYTFSTDYGVSWADVQVLGDYNGGLGGRPRLVTDSLDIIHGLFGLVPRTPPFQNAIATLENELWSMPAPVPGTTGQDHPALAVTSGNRLHVVWSSQLEPAEIWYTTCVLDAPESTLLPRASMAPVLTHATESTPFPVLKKSTLSTDSSGPVVNFDFDKREPVHTAALANSTLWGTVMAFGVVLTVTSYVLVRRKRN